MNGCFPDKHWSWKTAFQDKALPIHTNNNDKYSICRVTPWFTLLCYALYMYWINTPQLYTYP